jgi:FAD/FMN-containing dehydrogenase/Fe-S oxidoreductase
MTRLPLVDTAPEKAAIHADFYARLRERVLGEVRTDALTRGIHATDASHYQVEPSGVFWPRNEDDLRSALALAWQTHTPLTIRGAATSLSGQTHGPGVIVDVSRHLDEILEIDVEGRFARVQPGVILEQLNRRLARHGLMFAPDPATASRATLGGLIGNNSSGARSLRWGKTSDHVLGLRLALADEDATVIDVSRRQSGPEVAARVTEVRGDSSAPASGSDLAEELLAATVGICSRNAEQIRQRYPRVMRRVSGYALDSFLPEKEPHSLTDLIVGSEGTLAVVLEATLKLVERPRATALCVVHFDDVLDSLRALPRLLECNPLAIEMLDDVILSEARTNAATRSHADFFVGQPKALQIVELDGPTPEAAAARAQELSLALRAEGIGTAAPVMTDPEQQAGVWETRRLGLGLISNVKGPRKGQAFIEDACVPVDKLAAYIEFVMAVCAREATPVSIYAHASVGVLHARPMIDLHQQGEIDKMRRIAEACFERVKEYGGSWSGEHGDGLVRGEFLERFYGSDITAAFREVKTLFDPRGLLNPGKLIDPAPMDQSLRYQVPGYAAATARSDDAATFRYRDQGGLTLAVEQCNGVGACRKIGSGVMCPSYMATRDEAHSTRGRANALRLAISGQLGDPLTAIASDELHDVLALCLSCKACKSECPNAVDMAKLKSEALYQRAQLQRVPVADRLTGALPLLVRMASGPQAWLINRLQSSRWFRHSVLAALGFDPSRSLPSFSTRPLRRAGRGSKKLAQGKQTSILNPEQTPEQGTVVLYVDTYSRYFEPQVCHDAVTLLEALGYRVVVADTGDSQRSRLSVGLLDAARRDGQRLLEQLDTTGPEASPILCLEPSCASSLTDDLPDLLDDDLLCARVAGRVQLIDGFLAHHSDRLEGRYPTLFEHRHCHARALFPAHVWRLSGVEIIDSGAGCCGMAGAFGYRHAEVSRLVAQDRLLPNLQSAAAQNLGSMAVIASGFSCRHQIRDLGPEGLPVVHPVQALRVRKS